MCIHFPKVLSSRIQEFFSGKRLYVKILGGSKVANLLPYQGTQYK